MLYKTIVLELLTDRPELHEQLRQARRLLPTVEAMAADLRDRHTRWARTLARRDPNGPIVQLSAEALELAIAELEFPSPMPTT